MANVKIGILKEKDIKIRSYNYSIVVIKFLRTISTSPESLIIKNQLLRAATSVGANIAEAQSSSSRKEFTRFYTISLRSCNECIYWISILKDIEINKQIVLDCEEILTETTEISKMIGACIRSLKGKR